MADGQESADASPVDAEPPIDAEILPASCAAVLADNPSALSGMFDVDPDGAGSGAPVAVYCDMLAAGGGWTVVYFPAGEVNSLDIPYLPGTGPLVADASEALIAYRNSSKVALTGVASFAIPNDWRTDSPFNYPGNDVAADVSINGGAAVAATVRYGRRNFAALCTDAWTVNDEPAAQYGRICASGTAAPFHTGFASTSVDQCTDSSMAYNTAACTNDRRFSIAVR